MTRIKNESGYSLLMVLFLIILIMILSSIFFRASLSNAKQEVNVDINNNAVIAAEMGIDYYKTWAINEYNILSNILTEQAKRDINTLINSKDFKKMNSQQINTKLEEIRQSIIYSLAENMRKMNTIQPPSNINKNMKFDRLNNFNLIQIEEGITINAEVKGINHSQSKKLYLEMQFKVPKLTLEGFVGDSAPENNASSPSVDINNLYPNTVGIPLCTDNLKDKTCIANASTFINKNINNSTIFFPSGYDKLNNSNNTNFNNSKIYSKGTLELKNLNGIQDISFYITGKFKAKNLSSGFKNSRMFVNGEIEVDQLNMYSSDIIVKGSLIVNKHLTLNQNSKICVSGTLNAQKKLTINSGQVIVFGTSNKAGVKFVNSEQQLWNECYGKSDLPIENVWTQPYVDVRY